MTIGAILAACSGGPSPALTTPGPGTSPTGSAVATSSDAPTGTPAPTETAGGTPTPELTGPPATTPAGACSGNDDNRDFFDDAAIAMSWAVYCAVLPDGWFLETGSYRLADGGILEVTYRGPADARLALVEGNLCDGADVETCAPRDTVIGPASFGDRDGELGRFANSLVLDVDRGATPSWRATGLGLTEEGFRALGAALIRVDG